MRRAQGLIRNALLLLLVFHGVVAAALGDEPIERQFLSYLPEQNVKVGWGAFGKSGWCGFEPQGIDVQGVGSLHGLGMHPDAHVEYALGKKYRSFRGTAAMNYTTQQGGPQRPVLFRVLGDGKQLWESYGMHQPPDCQPCLLDITGVEVLRLEVIYAPGTEGHGNMAHAVWVDPFVSTEEPSKEQLKYFNPERYLEYAKVLQLLRQSRIALEQEEFAKVEDFAKRIRTEDFSAQMYHPRFRFYERLANPWVATAEGWQAHLDKLARWKAAFPDSVAPRIALAKAYTDYGFVARGTGWAHSVTPEGWKLFGERMKKAVDEISDPPKNGEDDIERIHCLLQLVRNTSADTSQMKKLFNKTRKVDPCSYEILLTVADTLDPRWGGRPGEMQEYADSLRKEIGGVPGNVAYLICANSALIHYNENVYEVSRFDYAKLKPGILYVLENHPEQQMILSSGCALACFAGDFETARKIFPLLDPATCHTVRWKGYAQFQEWRKKAGAVTIPATGPPSEMVVSPGRESWWKSFRPIAGNKLVSLHAEHLLLWDAKTLQIEDRKSLPFVPQAFDFEADGSTVLLGSAQPEDDAFVHLYKLPEFELECSFAGGDSVPSRFRYSADGKRIAAVMGDSVYVWQRHKPEEPPVRIKPEEPPYRLSLSTDGSQVAVATEHGFVGLYDTAKGELIGAPLVNNHQGPWLCVPEFFGDNKRLLTASVDGTVRIWNLENRTADQITGQAQPWIRFARVSPDGRWLGLIRDGKPVVGVFDLEQKKHVLDLVGHTSFVADFVFSADSKKIYTGSADQSGRIWDVTPEQ